MRSVYDFGSTKHRSMKKKRKKKNTEKARRKMLRRRGKVSFKLKSGSNVISFSIVLLLYKEIEENH